MEKQLTTRASSKREGSTAKKVCIACGNSNFDECNCIRKPEKKSEIDGKLEELFAAQKKKMSVPEYRQYQHRRKCYMHKHKVPYSEMIMGHGKTYDDYNWPEACDIYHQNSLRIQDALLRTKVKEISLYSIVHKGKENDKIRAMFNNHQMIAEALGGNIREKGDGYDHYSWQKVCSIYHENSVRIQDGLEDMGKEAISLNSMDPHSEKNDMLRVMFNNHQNIADGLAGSSRDQVPLYDDCSWELRCCIYHENSMRLQDAMQRVGIEISLYSLVSDSKENDIIRAMFNNHQIIADALAESCRDKGPGYDIYSYEQVCDIYHENLTRIQDALGILGIKIGLSSLAPSDSNDEMIRTMFNNHRTLAEVLARSRRNKRGIQAFLVAAFGGVFAIQTIAGYLIGKGLDKALDSLFGGETKIKPTLSDLARVLAQPELFGKMQEWLYNCKDSNPMTEFDLITPPTNMRMHFHNGQQIIKIPKFEREAALTGVFDYSLKNMFLKPYYQKMNMDEEEIDSIKIREFAAMLFHKGQISFRNAEADMDNSEDYDYAKFMTENYLNQDWHQQA